jgi:hypothetical protein
MAIQRGDIYRVNLEPTIGSEQQGNARPQILTYGFAVFVPRKIYRGTGPRKRTAADRSAPLTRPLKHNESCLALNIVPVKCEPRIHSSMLSMRMILSYRSTVPINDKIEVRVIEDSPLLYGSSVSYGVRGAPNLNIRRRLGEVYSNALSIALKQRVVALYVQHRVLPFFRSLVF